MQPGSNLLDTSNPFISMIFQGGMLSVLVLIVLLIMSMISWTLILKKWFTFSSAKKSAQRFLKNFLVSNGLNDIKHRSELFPRSYLTQIFQAANAVFEELVESNHTSKTKLSRKDSLSNIERNIEKNIIYQNLKYEKNLIILATISSSAPFIGLLGTVTGIIDAFYSIGMQGASSIAVVAPGISAALVATGFGLFAAIPALIAYNMFRNMSREINNEMIAFGFDLMTLFNNEHIAIIENKERVFFNLDATN